jgi:hypothetical protein
MESDYECLCVCECLHTYDGFPLLFLFLFMSVLYVVLSFAYNVFSMRHLI